MSEPDPDRAVAAPCGVLLMAHGTPGRLEDLPAFYTAIRRGRPPPPELLEDLRRRYLAIGGTSPLTTVTRAQARAVAAHLEARAPGRFVVALGARFAEPSIEAALAALARGRVTRVAGVVLAPHSSVVSVGEYARRARAAAEHPGPGLGPVALEMVDHWYDDPAFVELAGDYVASTLRPLPRGRTRVVFSAHSVPQQVVDEGDPYPDQVRKSAAAVAGCVGLQEYDVAFQSAGRTPEPWVGPDLLDVIRSLAGTGTTTCAVVPIGFVSDHLEVLYDIDVEAQAVAAEVGVALVRTPSFNDDPRFAAVVGDVAARALAGRG